MALPFPNSIILFLLGPPLKTISKADSSSALRHLDVLILALHNLFLGTLALGTLLLQTLLLILLLHRADRGQKVIRHGLLLVEEGKIKGNIVPLVCQRRRCTLLHKQLDCVEMSAQGCPVKTRVSVLVCLVQEGLFLLLWPVVKVLDELSDDFYSIIS